MRILLLKTWKTNIGNEIIEGGAEFIIKKACPKCELIKISGYNNYFNYYNNSNIINKMFYKYDDERKFKLRGEGIEIASMLENIDIVVLPGCVLDQSLAIYYDTLKKISEMGKPILLLGVGGSYYNNKLRDLVNNILGTLNIKAIISRDREAFKYYSKAAQYCYDGIDCGFYINDYYQPPKANQRYVISCFDNAIEPRLTTDDRIIRTCHSPFDYALIQDSIYDLLKLKYIIQRRDISIKNNIFISDQIEDYLFLYANAIKIYTNRIHACVAGLSYSTPSILYTNSPRSALLKRVPLYINQNGEMNIKTDEMKKEKQNQIEFIINILNQIK